MNLSSSFEDFSLGDLFRMVDQGHKSGCLTLCTLSNPQDPSTENYHYIWFKQGRVVAASERLDGRGLIAKITNRGWLSERVIEKLASVSSEDMPLGLILKTQGAIQSEQLNLLFRSQIQEICKLFEVTTGRFELNGKSSFPTSEMTGLSISGLEVAIAGLRTLKSWQNIAHALPDTSSALKRISTEKPHLRLNALELQVWEFAKGKTSIEKIAHQINQSVEKIQQVAFRLITVGLIEEIPLIASNATLKDSFLKAYEPEIIVETKPQARKIEQREKPKVSNSFLQNLVGFLRSKA